jgi:alkanesulfonate monooxygenase SsuD/methylene tetrahydromethanopterin reductase-like flavin-dependent oxidoreductase (luciferase family)
MNQRVGRILESIEIMRRLWHDDGVSFSGRYHEVTEGSINPKPLQAGGIPIYLGGMREPVLRRVARVADGWVAGAGTAESFLSGVETVLGAAREIQRDPATLGFAKLQNISVAPAREEAREQGERHWKSYYGPAFNIEGATIFGTPDECREKLAAFMRAACDEVTLVLEPAGLSTRQLEMLAEITVDSRG